jgi:hypothetical protein
VLHHVLTALPNISEDQIAFIISDKQSTPLEPLGSEDEGTTDLHIVSNYLPVNKILITQKTIPQYSILVDCVSYNHHNRANC